MPAETVVVQAFRPAVSGRPEGLHYFRRFPSHVPELHYRWGAGLHFRLCAQDGAPVLVLGRRHPALRANENALLRVARSSQTDASEMT